MMRQTASKACCPNLPRPLAAVMPVTLRSCSVVGRKNLILGCGGTRPPATIAGGMGDTVDGVGDRGAPQAEGAASGGEPVFATATRRPPASAHSYPPDRPARSRARSGGSGGEHLGRELVAVLAGHGPLDSVADGRDRTSIVLELSVLCDSPAPSRLLSLQRECSISSD
jgi:hypothetical protein